MAPAVISAVPTVAMISSLTTLSTSTENASTDASGVASCQISFISILVAVVCAINPAVVIDVPTSSVALAPARLAVHLASSLQLIAPVTWKIVDGFPVPLWSPFSFVPAVNVTVFSVIAYSPIVFLFASSGSLPAILKI